MIFASGCTKRGGRRQITELWKHGMGAVRQEGLYFFKVAAFYERLTDLLMLSQTSDLGVAVKWQRGILWGDMTT